MGEMIMGDVRVPFGSNALDALAGALEATKQEARRVADLIARGQPKVGGKKATKAIVKPTPEQRHQAHYELTEVLDRSPKGRAIVIGKAYMRVPWFETMYARNISEIDRIDLKCLRFYRRAFEAANRSEMKSCLNRSEAAGSSPRLPALFAMTYDLTMCEEAIGSLVDTMRAVVLQDMTFKAVAMQRFGSREEVVWKAGVRTTKLIPISKAHVATIADEFALGLSRLRGHAESYVKVGR